MDEIGTVAQCGISLEITYVTMRLRSTEFQIADTVVQSTVFPGSSGPP